MTNQPVAINVALGTVVSTGVTLAALLIPGMTPELQVAIVAFANSVIFVAVIIITKAQVTPVANPALPQGSVVKVLNDAGEALPDRVEIQPTPPGPLGVDPTTGQVSGGTTTTGGGAVSAEFPADSDGV